MFAAVWMIYAADRLLDARLLDSRLPDATHPLEERHRFHHRHRSRFLAAIVIAACALAALLPHLDARALTLYTLLTALFAAWMLLIHTQPSPQKGDHRLPKELAVGVFFPAAVFIPTVARASALQRQLLPAAALLACVCTLNCLFLYAWEHPRDTDSTAHWTTLWATRHLPQLSIAVLLAAVAIALSHTLAAIPALACSLSTSLLILLHAQRHRLSPLDLRAAADLALLTPLLLLPIRGLFPQ